MRKRRERALDGGPQRIGPLEIPELRPERRASRVQQAREAERLRSHRRRPVGIQGAEGEEDVCARGHEVDVPESLEQSEGGVGIERPEVVAQHEGARKREVAAGRAAERRLVVLHTEANEIVEYGLDVRVNCA